MSVGGANLMATRRGVNCAICSLRLSVALAAAPAFMALEPESRDVMMKLYARLLPRMPRPGAPVCNWWAALGQFFFSTSRSNLPARPHVVVAPRRALRGPHGSRIAGRRPRTQRPWRCAHSRSRPRTSSLRHQTRPRVVAERPARPRHGPGSLTRSAHVRSAVSSNNQCQRPPPRTRS